MFARVFVVDAADVGEQHQQVGLELGRDQRREPVVVAKNRARAAGDERELFGGDGIVFVDDRHHPAAQQRDQGATQVEIAHAVVEIALGEQHLRADQPEPRKGFLVEAHQPALADRGAGLAFLDLGGGFGEPERLAAEPDRARADNQHVAPGPALSRSGLGDRGEARKREAAVVMGEHAGAQLDDDALGGGDLGSSGLGLHRRSPKNEKAPRLSWGLGGAQNYKTSRATRPPVSADRVAADGSKRRRRRGRSGRGSRGGRS